MSILKIILLVVLAVLLVLNLAAPAVVSQKILNIVFIVLFGVIIYLTV